MLCGVYGPSANPNDGFAWVYDRFFGDSFLKSSSRVLEELFTEKVPKGAQVLDLCCGPGRVARDLAERGYSVTGVDSSQAMLNLASKMAPSCEFIEADARTFNLGRTFQGCICLSASMNQFMVIAEVGAVFQRVREHLVPGARFLFDMNMEAVYSTRWKSPYSRVSEEDALIVRPRFDAKTKAAKVEMTAFRLGSTGLWERSDWAFQQRCYSERDVKSELKRASFRDVKAHDSGDFKVDDGGRMFFVATA